MGRRGWGGRLRLRFRRGDLSGGRLGRGGRRLGDGLFRRGGLGWVGGRLVRLYVAVGLGRGDQDDGRAQPLFDLVPSLAIVVQRAKFDLDVGLFLHLEQGDRLVSVPGIGL